jgi:hypothetical protein
MESRSLGRIFMVESETGEKALLVEILINCPVCGTDRIRLAGHHLRMVRDICIDAIDQYPELSGTEPRVVNHTDFKGRMNDPSSS